MSRCQTSALKRLANVLNKKNPLATLLDLARGFKKSTLTEIQNETQLFRLYH
jgi:hypothetical protein